MYGPFGPFGFVGSCTSFVLPRPLFFFFSTVRFRGAFPRFPGPPCCSGASPESANACLAPCFKYISIYEDANTHTHIKVYRQYCCIARVIAVIIVIVVVVVSASRVGSFARSSPSHPTHARLAPIFRAHPINHAPGLVCNSSSYPTTSTA